MMSRASRTLAAAALLVIALAPAVAGQANAASSAPSSTAAPSPTPTLGSNTPASNPPGSANSSPRDYNGSAWVVGAILVVAAIVGGGTLYLTRTHRLDLTQLSPPDEDDTQNGPPAVAETRSDSDEPGTRSGGGERDRPPMP